MTLFLLTEHTQAMNKFQSQIIQLTADKLRILFMDYYLQLTDSLLYFRLLLSHLEKQDSLNILYASLL